MQKICLVLVVAGAGGVFAPLGIAQRHPGGSSHRVDAPASPTDPAELRSVTEAISRIIAASESQRESAVQSLESVRANSAGARDLKDACVNTYRSAIRAAQLIAELSRLVAAADGGQLRADQIPRATVARATELQRRASEQIDLARRSTDRCMDLYTAATHTIVGVSGSPAASTSVATAADSTFEIDGRAVSRESFDAFVSNLRDVRYRIAHGETPTGGVSIRTGIDASGVSYEIEDASVSGRRVARATRGAVLPVHP